MYYRNAKKCEKNQQANEIEMNTKRKKQLWIEKTKKKLVEN